MSYSLKWYSATHHTAILLALALAAYLPGGRLDPVIALRS
jgi:hypothetical protein